MYRITSETADQDLTEYWAGFIARINKTTEWDLNQGNPASIDQLMLRINPPKDNKPESHEKVKKVWRNALVCVDKLGVFVQRFGQFIVQGTSIVFGPSQQCFNAISFVITAAQKYKEVFANITTLMERISVFLENLSVFMDDAKAEVKLDKRLRKTVYRVLEHFVVILGTTHKLTTDWKARAKLAVKNFALGEDENIQGSLQTLETLVSDFTNTSITVIVKDLGDAAKNIRGVEKKIDVLDEKQDKLLDSSEKQVSMLGQLVVADDKKAAREAETKDLDTIKSALDLESFEESRKVWDRQKELYNDRVQGTGQWLLEKPSFSKWSDPKQTSVACYTLKAPPGFGKSYLTSIVTQHLINKHRETPHVFVAYYYIQAAPGSKASDRISPISKAIKTLIFQFANARRSEYAKAAAKVCEGKTDFSSTGEIWRRLISDTTKNLDGTLFLVLDGLVEQEGREEVLSDVINQVVADERSNAESRFKVRVFLSGTHGFIDSLNLNPDVTLPEVNIKEASSTDQSSLNETDIKLYIDDQLNKMDRFDKSETALKERIKTELSNGVRGDYSQLLLLLHDISSSQYTSQIEEVLKRAGQSRADLIASKIGILNDTLDKKEIRDINELLHWVTAGYEWMDSKQLEAVLSLKGDPPRFLEKQIRERYNTLFELDDSKQVSLRDGVLEYLKQINEAAGTARSQADNRAADTIQEMEVSLVRKILQTHFRNVFGDEQVYSKFRFDDFFEKKLGDQAVRVQLDEAESHTRLAQGCFAAMCDKYTDPTVEVILDYAYKWFVEHLGEVKLDQTEATTKQDLGRKLVRLLREPALIESWWTRDRMYLKQWFVYSEYSKSLIQWIHDFLKDPLVLQGMSDMPNQRQWIVKVTSGEAPSFELYSSIATIMARRWFEAEDDDDWQPAFDWVSGYLRVLRDEFPEVDDSVTVEFVDEVTAWAKKELKNDLSNAADKSVPFEERIAATFFYCEGWEKAAECYRQAIELNPDDWRLQKSLSKSLGNNEDYDEAVSTLEDLMQRNAELLQSNDEYTTAYWDEMVLDLGDWNVQREDFEAAEKAYWEILNHSFEEKKFQDTEMSAAVGMLSALNSQDRHGEVAEFLSQLATYSEPEGVSWLTLLFQENCQDESFHLHLTTAAKRSQIVRNIADQYEHAIEAIRPQTTSAESSAGSLSQLLYLQHFLASLLWAMGSEQDQDAALELWQQILSHEPNDETDPEYEQRVCQLYTTKRFSSALLSRAKGAGIQLGVGPDAAMYRDRLEWLIESNSLGTVGGISDPRILLARFYHLAGDDARSRSIAGDYVRRAIRDIPEKSEDYEVNRSFYRLAMALQALDDDDNAIAAWCQLLPNDISKEAPEDGDADDEQNEAADSDAKTGAEDIETEEDASAPHVNGVDADEAETTSSATEEDSDDPELTGELGNTCDGQCGTKWTYADDIWVCKDCLDVQMDYDCYMKLKSGDLDVALCGRDHEFLHVPPFDLAEWRKIPKDSMVVGGKVVSRQAWIDELAKTWEADAESVENRKNVLNAAHRIQRAWKVFKALRKEDGGANGT